MRVVSLTFELYELANEKPKRAREQGGKRQIVLNPNCNQRTHERDQFGRPS